MNATITKKVTTSSLGDNFNDIHEIILNLD